MSSSFSSSISQTAGSKNAEAARENSLTEHRLSMDKSLPGTRRNFLGMIRPPKMSKVEIVNFTAQLAIMFRSGVDIVSAIDSLAKQAKSESSQDILDAILEDLNQGKPFSVALKRFECVFGPSYVASVSAGEASGKMSEVLAHIASLLRGELKLRNTLRTMMAYPIILVSISLLVIVALVIFVLPQFAKVFSDFDTPLPWITRALLAISSELIGRGWLWLPVSMIAIGSLIVFVRTNYGRRLKDHLLLNLLVVRDVTRALMIGRVLRLLGLLIESGVPLLESLTLVKVSQRNWLYRKLFAEIEQSVLRGGGLGTSLIDAAFVPTSAAEMILTAERTGTLDSVTQMVGEHYEEDGQERLRGLVAVIEPAITVVMGVVVAVVVMSVALPMFDLATFGQN
jgi:type II secretory pathway component PulF